MILRSELIQPAPVMNAVQMIHTETPLAAAAPISALQPMAKSRNAPTASSTSSTACSIHSIDRV
jgi:hypothetical protein